MTPGDPPPYVGEAIATVAALILVLLMMGAELV
jgi:hypothetical protein